MAYENEGFELHDPFEEVLFDAFDHYHIDALEDLVVQMIDGVVTVPSDVSLTKKDGAHELSINGVFIASYEVIEDSYIFTISEDFASVNKNVLSSSALVELLQSMIMENQ